jgi:TolB-like protein
MASRFLALHIRGHMIGSALLVATGVGALAIPLAAQCPDGTPPPCGPRSAAPPANSVAVLYFDNLSRDSADAYLADGLTEEILARLAQVSRIDVRSRFASRRFQRVQVDPEAVARSLGVRYLVSGSVQPVGARLRVRVELLRAGRARPLWAEIYDRPRDELAAVLDETSRAIASAIAGRLLPDERTRLAPRQAREPGAFEDYLVGRAMLNRYTPGDLRAAVARLERAAQRDPGFVDAWAMLGFTWAILWNDFRVARAEALPRLRDAAARALALDSTHPVAVLARSAALFYDADWEAAEPMARAAFAARPRDPTVLIALAAVLGALEKPDSAVTIIRQAVVLDSLSPFVRAAAIYRMYGARLLEAADSQLAALHQLLPDPPPQPGVWLRIAQGRCADARSSSRGWRLGVVMADACAQRGEEAVRAVEALYVAGEADAVDVAMVAAIAGRADDGFRWLDRALVERPAMLGFVRDLKMLDPLRADPRWGPWMARLRATAGSAR